MHKNGPKYFFNWLLGHYQTEAYAWVQEQVPGTPNDGDQTPTTPGGSQSSGNMAPPTSDQDLISTTPSNLLVTFLEYCSIVMQDTKSDSSINTVKLSFLILLCVTEDQYANALMHDPNLVFAVKLHRAPMRHRKPNVGGVDTSSVTGGQSRSLACSVMDLMVEFIRSHLMKRVIYFLKMAWPGNIQIRKSWILKQNRYQIGFCFDLQQDRVSF